jgi:hypothetical protein
MKYTFILRKVGHLRLFNSAIQYFAEQPESEVEVLILNHANINEEKILENAKIRIRNIKIIDSNHNRIDFQEYLLTWGHWFKYRNKLFNTSQSINSRATEELRASSPTSIFTLPLISLIPQKMIFSFLSTILRNRKSNKEIYNYLQLNPTNALIISPLIEFNAHQLDWIKVSKELSIPSFFAVHSWDNLTNKGRLLLKPDFCIVWNKYQVEELQTIHDFPWSRVLVTGAYGYDHWFKTAANHTQKFRSKALTVNKFGESPYLLFVGSSKFIVQNRELEFLEKLLPLMKEVGWNLVVRPHPQNQIDWESLSGDNLFIHPNSGQIPVGDDYESIYVDSLQNASAVLGVNTSALLEASIFGSPTFVISNDDFVQGQQQTVHFKYLKNSDSIKIVKTPLELIGVISELNNGKKTQNIRNQELFLLKFLRPQGLHVSASEVMFTKINSAIENYHKGILKREKTRIFRFLCSFVNWIIYLLFLVIVSPAYLLDLLLRIARSSIRKLFKFDTKTSIKLFNAAMRGNVIKVSLNLINMKLKFIVNTIYGRASKILRSEK